ncbi:uncharacterized protein LOC108109446 [Drosophila eugracilis]|uniref:uncharacterized protein LOC108109446 n=1 Tax=Drosophila eugracilis TaxID=29029 RepID=UPI0007E68D2E|nr:uncharacterized protein LOC108109446 [Drosophila eugracilis]
MKFDLETILSTLLKMVRRKKKKLAAIRDCDPEDREEVMEDNDDIEDPYENDTEGIFNWVCETILNLSMIILEQLFDFVKRAILDAVDVAKDAVECFTKDYKVQIVALKALVEFLTKNLGLNIAY